MPITRYFRFLSFFLSFFNPRGFSPPFKLDFLVFQKRITSQPRGNICFVAESLQPRNGLKHFNRRMSMSNREIIFTKLTKLRTYFYI